MGLNYKIQAEVNGFKQGMRDAQSSAKMLEQQLKKNEAQLKATGDKEQYLTEKQRLLNEKLKEQKTAAANAEKAMKTLTENGVKESSKEYQNLQNQLIKAQTEMYNTEAALNDLAAGEQKAADGADKLTSGLSGISKKMSLEQVSNGIKSITGMLESAAGKAVSLGEAIWENVMNSAKWADDTATMALMYGIDLDTFQRMQKLVQNGMDTSVDAILKAQSKLKNNVGKGGDSIMDTLRELGLLQAQAGKYGPVELIPENADDLFWSAGRALMNLTDEYEQEAKAQALFGRSWKELIPLFTTYGSQAEYNQALENVNVNTEEEVTALAALSDKVGELEGNLETLSNSIWATMAPALTEGAEALNGLLESVIEYLQKPEGQAMLEGMANSISELFGGLEEITPESVVGKFAEILGTVTSGLGWLKDNKEAVFNALKVIAEGFALLKISELALNIGRIVSGLGGLAASGSGATGTESPTVIPTGSTQVGGGKTGLLSNLVNGMAVKTVLDDAFTIMETSKKAFEGLTQQEAQLKILMHDFGMTEQQAIEFDKLLGNEYEVEVEPVPVDNAAEILEKEIGPISVLVVPQLSQPGMFPGGAGGSGVFSYALGVSEDYHPHANGLFSVPWDGYPAILHKGERVMTAREVAASRNYTYNSHNYFGNVNLNNGQDIEALCDSIDRHNRRQQTGYGS